MYAIRSYYVINKARGRRPCGLRHGISRRKLYIESVLYMFLDYFLEPFPILHQQGTYFFKMNHDKYRDWAQLSVKAEHYTKSTSYCISVFDKPSRNYAVRAWMNEGIIEWMVNQFHNFKIKYNKQF